MITVFKLLSIVRLYRYGSFNMHKASPWYVVLNTEPIAQTDTSYFTKSLISNGQFLGQIASSI